MALTGEKRLVIEYLKRQGYSVRRIARELGINRETVRSHLEEPGKPRYRRTVPYSSQVAPHKEYILSRLKDYPDMTAQKLYREIRERGFGGSYRAVAYYVRKNRPVKEQEVFLRYETAPGEEAQADWAEFGKINHYGKECKLYCFMFVWGYSRRHYIEFTTGQDIHTLMRCHERAFDHFGGVPRRIVYDNMAQVVLSNTGTKIEYNQKFMDFAMHYGFLPDACHVGEPHEKGKVERLVDYVRGSFFTGEEYGSLEELNSKALHWSAEIADKRVHGTTHERPLDRWETERKALLPLPGKPYDTRRLEHRVAQKDCYINWDGNCYWSPLALCA